MPPKLVLAALAVAPLLALAEPPGGACTYTTADPAARKLSYCTQVSTQERCLSEAASKSSATWVAAHPPRFAKGKDCTEGGKLFGKGAKGAAKRKGAAAETRPASGP